MLIPLWLAVAMALVLVFATFWIVRLIDEQKLRLREQEFASEQARLELLLQTENEKLQQLRTTTEELQLRMQRDFENVANRIFDEKQKSFSQQSKQTLDMTVLPLKENLEGFRRRVDEIHAQDLADRNRLKGQIEELQRQAQKIGGDALQLAQALKGESKTQGNWGEMVLERILEESGLVKGREYETQVSLQNSEGNRRNPDVIIHLPEGKDLVIDAKVSLTAYERYCREELPLERANALQAHIASIRSHIRGLSRKSYENLEGLRTLDFVFLFVPVEPAFLLALEHDQTLFRDAYDNNIVLVCPSTLLATLRTVQSIWRYENQNRHALEIAEKAGRLFDQFVLFVESLDDVGRHIEKTQTSYQEARKRLTDGRGNLVRRTEELRLLGAKAQKQLPSSVQDGLDHSDETEAKE